MSPTLTTVSAGMPLVYDGNKLAFVGEDVAARFQPGDQLLVVSGSGDILHLPFAVCELVRKAVDGACRAFQEMSLVDDSAVTRFYERFAARLASDDVWARIAAANEQDVEAARSRGRSTTRLVAGDKMRRDMIAGLMAWRDLPGGRESVAGTVEHQGWKVEQVVDGLGVVGFVFEGRPNVFADATGILRGGNTAAMRIGGDALGTARAIAREALQPALAEAGLPEGAITLIDSAEHAAGWALFSDRRLALAVARGSGRAVAQLGSIARQTGIAASLHGTGGAWIVAGDTAASARLEAAVYHSLDRKVCNTANVVLIVESRAADLVPVALRAVQRRGDALGTGFKLHVLEGARPYVPAALFEQRALIYRAGGPVEEAAADSLAEDELGTEWEWEATPELSLGVVASVERAVSWFNSYSPRLVASLIADDPAAQERFFRMVDAPFVGNGFTRWVDGQYALNRPELGLSNWQNGRLFGRGGVLSGDGVFTVRLRVTQQDPDLHR